MPCTGRYAEAIDYAVTLDCTGVYAGLDDSGGAANAFLTDTTVNFVDLGVTVGNPTHNTTTGTYGTITGVTATVLQTTNTWSDGDSYIIALMSASEVATINLALDMTAALIFPALAAQGACSCTFASWANLYLAQLNALAAAAYRNCPCGGNTLTEDARTRYLLYVQQELGLIRTGQYEFCAGYTGSDFPAIATAEQSWTNWRAAEIIIDAQRRKP